MSTLCFEPASFAVVGIDCVATHRVATSWLPLEVLRSEHECALLGCQKSWSIIRSRLASRTAKNPYHLVKSPRQNWLVLLYDIKTRNQLLAWSSPSRAGMYLQARSLKRDQPDGSIVEQLSSSMSSATSSWTCKESLCACAYLEEQNQKHGVSQGLRS